jgi:hypothetical protein
MACISLSGYAATLRSPTPSDCSPQLTQAMRTAISDITPPAASSSPLRF